MKKNILSKAISAVGVVSAAFGGALTNAQPPDSSGQAAGFIGSFSCLIILLIISAVGTYNKIDLRKIWISVAILALAAFIYFSLNYSSYKEDYVVGYPPESAAKEYFVIGDILGEDGKAVKAYLIENHKDLTPENYLEYGNGTPNINNIWTPSSRNVVSEKLRNKYLLVMICVSLAIFSITEGVFLSIRNDSH